MIELVSSTLQSEWLQKLTSRFLEVFNRAILARGKLHVALSGGSTPKAFYSALNKMPLDWDKIEWWLGDERAVPPSEESSNEKMVRETLGYKISQFESHFHSWHMDSDPEAAAFCYEKKLRELLGSPPQFDLVLLGLGLDGHTASLFPGTEALQEEKRYALAYFAPNVHMTRMTLTYPVLNASREVWFLIQDKEPMVKRLLAKDQTIPAGKVAASIQKIYWLNDSNSAQ